MPGHWVLLVVLLAGDILQKASIKLRFDVLRMMMPCGRLSAGMKNGPVRTNSGLVPHAAGEEFFRKHLRHACALHAFSWQ